MDLTLGKQPLIDDALIMDRNKKNDLMRQLKRWNRWLLLAFGTIVVYLPLIILSLSIMLQQSLTDSVRDAWFYTAIASSGIAGVMVILVTLGTYRAKKRVSVLVTFFPPSFADEPIFIRYYEAKSANRKPTIGYFSTRQIISFLEVYNPYEDSTNRKVVPRPNASQNKSA